MYRRASCIIERYVPHKVVLTKCKFQHPETTYNLYLVRRLDASNKRNFVWEHELDVENKHLLETKEKVDYKYREKQTSR